MSLIYLSRSDQQRVWSMKWIPQKFDHFHFHGSGGLILWYDLREAPAWCSPCLELHPGACFCCGAVSRKHDSHHHDDGEMEAAIVIIIIMMKW